VKDRMSLVMVRMW